MLNAACTNLQDVICTATQVLCCSSCTSQHSYGVAAHLLTPFLPLLLLSPAHSQCTDCSMNVPPRTAVLLTILALVAATLQGPYAVTLLPTEASTAMLEGKLNVLAQRATQNWHACSGVRAHIQVHVTAVLVQHSRLSTPDWERLRSVFIEHSQECIYIERLIPALLLLMRITITRACRAWRLQRWRSDAATQQRCHALKGRVRHGPHAAGRQHRNGHAVWRRIRGWHAWCTRALQPVCATGTLCTRLLVDKNVSRSKLLQAVLRASAALQQQAPDRQQCKSGAAYVSSKSTATRHHRHTLCKTRQLQQMRTLSGALEC